MAGTSVCFFLSYLYVCLFVCLSIFYLYLYVCLSSLCRSFCVNLPVCPSVHTACLSLMSLSVRTVYLSLLSVCHVLHLSVRLSNQMNNKLIISLGLWEVSNHGYFEMQSVELPLFCPPMSIEEVILL